jgi:hypothetical protein
MLLSHLTRNAQRIRGNKMRVVILFTVLVELSTVALAQDKNESNFYDVSKQWMKPTANFTIDEQATAAIKRHWQICFIPWTCPH